MPRKSAQAAAPLDEALAKKGGLTLKQLADYDDHITDALVDRVYYWTTIRKIHPKFHGSRGVREEDVTKILQTHVILNKDAAKATQELLKLPGLMRYHHNLKTPDEKEHFVRHLRKYVNMYLPDCPFEVCTTNRYQINVHEATATARRPIRKGEVVKYLSGIQVAMSKQEEKDLDVKSKDFSIVVSSRKKTPSLFLGPARFANHDCDSNARLSTTGAHGMQIVSVKDIDVGEEITVTYGDDYFGEDNCECLCATCERLLRNGWDPSLRAESEDGFEDEDEDESTLETPLETSNSPEVTEAGSAPEPAAEPESGSKPGSVESDYSLRSKRKFGATLESCDSTPTAGRSASRPSKRQKIASGDTACASPSTPTSIQESIKKEYDLSAAPDLPDDVEGASLEPQSLLALIRKSVGRIRYDYGRGKTASETDTPYSNSPAESSNLEVSGPPSVSTEPTSTEGTLEASDTIAAAQPPTSDSSVTKVSQSVELRKATSASSESELSELSDSYELDDSTHRVIKRKYRRTFLTRQSSRNLARSLPPFPTIESIESSAGPLSPSGSAPRRRPGDYTLTPRLLPTVYSRWIECRTCDEHFVQHDAYQTRLNCPRCERHSKLYGYAWPKTERDGKHDREERVLDHRALHRFVDPDEERNTRKGRKTLRSLILERERSLRESVSEEGEGGARKRLRSSS